MTNFVLKKHYVSAAKVQGAANIICIKTLWMKCAVKMDASFEALGLTSSASH
jgi:hypothetical protein